MVTGDRICAISDMPRKNTNKSFCDVGYLPYLDK